MASIEQNDVSEERINARRKFAHEKISVQWTLRTAGGLTLGIGMAALLTITLSWPGAFIGVPLAGMLLGIMQASYLKRFLAMGSEWLWATTLSRIDLGISRCNIALLSISSGGTDISLFSGQTRWTF